MARKTDTVIIEAAGRDQGKHFVLTEMSATQAEKWAIRAVLAVTKSGLDVPDDVAQMGMGAVAAMGLRAFTSVQFHDAEMLMDELMTCVRFMPDAGKSMVTRSLVEDDVEEVSTRLFLKAEVFRVHTGFSLAGEISKRWEATKAALPSKDTPTSRDPSA